MQITVKFREVYGRILIYPVCAKASLFAGLIGQKTFVASQLDAIADLGFRIVDTNGIIVRKMMT